MTSTATTDPAAPSLPPPEELRRRGVFRYRDGTSGSERVGCAITIQFRLQDACPGRDIHRVGLLLDAITAPTPALTPVMPAPEGDPPPEPPPEPINPIDAMMELAPLIGRGFDLADYDPVDGSGLNVTERITLLTDFYASFLATEAAPDDDPDEFRPADGPTPDE